ncbi:serine/threonine protein kinase [Enhygromyxa salina]|uniref:Serine/threonine protein kinase n=1 Tax=Enhygromyxa salina TaxID=215803 RepID=A0A0C2CWW6_9BACT|nr:AAA-like domain-containing protein [Enhygromyxa salina]KIG12342.1 serine/threonine protein kinase [Enhygromyxa salina]
MHGGFRHGDILLDKYRVEHTLGQGGMGTVVAARHVDLDELFAIKILRTGIAHSRHMMSRFVREARSAAHLRSPHVVRVYDVGSLPDGAPYMVMEHLRGCDLSVLVKRHGALPYRQACRLVAQACDAVGDAHGLGMVHRDIKLANLFLTHLRDGQPCLKVLDFGISKHLDSIDDLTTSGALLGSPRYMSPEQIRDAKQVDAQTDIWALGVVLYDLITGSAPFDGTNLPEVFQAVLEQEPPPPSRVVANIPAALDLLIMRCLAKRPHDRHAGAEALAAALEPFTATDEPWPCQYHTIAQEHERESGPPTATMPTDPSPSERQPSAVAGQHDHAEHAEHAVDPTRYSRPSAAMRADHNPPNRSQPQPPATQSAAGQPTVFISYHADASDELALARGLHTMLGAVGMRPLLAEDVGATGERVGRISHALESCDLFVVCVGKRGAVSELVPAELATMELLGERAAGPPKLLCVRIRLPPGNAEPQEIPGLGEALEHAEHVDWTGPEDTAAVLRAIVERAGHLASVTSPNGRVGVVPAATRVAPDLELPDGIVRASSRLYVSRPGLDDRCLAEIVKPGALIRVKGPRGSGKTSLMTRVLDHAASEDMRVVTVDLQLVDTKILSSLERFLKWFCAIVTRRLRLSRVEDSWDSVFGAKDNCTAYFEDHVLGEGDPLVLAINQVDRLFDVPNIAEEFLMLLRAWHEMAKTQPPWDQLRLLLSYSTEMYLPMDINHSPFNVGLAAPMADWDVTLVLDLARRHGLQWGEAEVGKLMALVGGHPHLIRIALYHIADRGTSLDEIFATAATEQGLFADHLKALLWQLQQQPSLAEASAKVMASSEPVRLATELAFKLVSLGVVRMVRDEVVPGRALYRRYLTERLA